MNNEMQNYFKVINGTALYYEKYVKYLQKQLEAYENMRKELKEYIEKKVICFKNGNLLLTELNVDDLLNILNKVGEDNE